MKKFVVLSLMSFLILAFGATVYGQEKAPALEFKASGWTSIETHYKTNVGYPPTAANQFFGPGIGAAYLPGGAAFDKKEAYVEQRGRLRFDAIMGKEMSGTFQFEFDSSRWGEVSPTVTGTTSAAAQRNAMGTWDTDRAALEVKHLYMTFGMPWIPIPTTIQAGLVPIGVRPRFVWANDGPGIIGAMKIDPATIRLMWFKQYEGNDYAADDDDVYAADFNAKIGTLTAGAYGIYFKLKNYPFPSVTPLTSTVNFKGYMFFPGVYVDGKLGPANLTFDFVYDTGKIEDSRDVTTRAKDVDYSGWATRFDLSMPWEKFVFGLVGVYGSGADAKKTSLAGLPGQTVGTGVAPYTAVSSKVGAYSQTPGNNNGPGDLFVINGHPDFLRGDSGLVTASSSGGLARSAFGGLWYLKLYGALPVTDMWRVHLAAAYIADTTKNGNSIGNARKSDNLTLRDDGSIGWEFDILNQFTLYKNLTFDVGFGYLVAGDAMDYYATATGNKSPKNPWILGTRLAYSW